MKKNGFFTSLGKRKLGVVLNLFYAYMSLGLVLIMLGSILPEMKADYELSYQVGGALLSVQSVGYVLAGLLAGYLPFLLGIKISFILIQLSVTLGFIMLLVSGNPVWLLIAMFLIGIGKGGITNYNNLLMNIYSEGNAGPLNILHACFAAGAVIAPLIVMVVAGWRPAVIIGCVCCAASLAFLLPAGFSDKDLETTDGPDISDMAENNRKKKVDYGFVKEKLFWVTVIICFFYQAVEASFMGWMTSFLIDTGVMAESLAQFTTSVLWMALMAGRLLCSAAARKFTPRSMQVHDPGTDPDHNRLYGCSPADKITCRADHSHCRYRTGHVGHVRYLRLQCGRYLLKIPGLHGFLRVPDQHGRHCSSRDHRKRRQYTWDAYGHVHSPGLCGMHGSGCDHQYPAVPG